MGEIISFLKLIKNENKRFKKRPGEIKMLRENKL